MDLTLSPDFNMFEVSSCCLYVVVYPNRTAGSLLATQEMMESCAKKNCFELYGADFMLTTDLKVK